MSNVKSEVKKKKVGKLKLNDTFKRKLESSIGGKISMSSSSTSTQKTSSKPKLKFPSLPQDNTPFIPPLPPNLIKKKEKETNRENGIVPLSDSRNVILPKERNIPLSETGGIVINNNITYPNISNVKPDFNNFFKENYDFILKLVSQNENREKKKKIIKKRRNILKQKISMQKLIYFFITFASGYFLGKIT
jgi:hypothetical protein